MHIQKETFRKFELQKLIFKTGPDAAQNPEGGTAEGLPQNETEFAQTPHMDKIQAVQIADSTKKEGLSAVIKASTDPESGKKIDDGPPVPSINLENMIQMASGMPDKMMANNPNSGSETGTTSTEKPKASPDKVAEGLYADKDVRIQILNFIAPGKDASKIDQAKFTEMIKAHGGFSKVLETVNVDEKGEFNLDQKGREAFATAIDKAMGTEGMKRPNQAEMKLIGEIKLDGKKTLGEIYGQEVVQMLSMQYETRIKEKGSPLEVKVGGEWVVLKVENMGKIIPNDIANAHEKQSDKAGVDAYKKLVGTKLEGLQKALVLRDAISGKEANEGSVNMFAKLKSIMLIVKMIQEGMKNGGDFGDFGDALADMQAGKDIIKNRDAATQEYAKQIAPIDDIGTLLSMHNNPHSGEAAKMFGEGEGASRYRKQLEVAVKQKLAPAFGTGTRIESIKDQNGTSTVKLNQGGETYYAEITPSAGFNKVKLMKVKMVDGQETFGPAVEGNVTDLKALGTNSLEGMLTMAKKGETPAAEATVAPEKTPPTPPASPAEGTGAEQKTDVPADKKAETTAPIG